MIYHILYYEKQQLKFYDSAPMSIRTEDTITLAEIMDIINDGVIVSVLKENGEEEE